MSISEEYKIFEPEDDRLEYYYKQLINKAFTIQNLLEISEGDPKVHGKVCRDARHQKLLLLRSY
jgi:hypothetical protein